MIIGQFTSAVFIIFQTMGDFKKSIKSLSIKKIFYVAKKYRDIPLFNSLISLINILSQQLPILLLARFYSAGIAGFYGLSHRIIGTPAGLISQSVGEVFFRRAIEKYNQKSDFYNFIKKTYTGLLKIAIIPYAILFFLTYYFDFIFGPDWEMSRKYADFYSLVFHNILKFSFNLCLYNFE